MNQIRPRWIPDGPKLVVRAKDSDAIAYLYGDVDKPAAVIYAGKAAKPYAWHRYASEERRAQHVAGCLRAIGARVAAKAEKAAEKRAWTNPYKVGDLFKRVWGYEQTNVDYYEVVGVRGKMLQIRKIGQAVKETGWLIGKCTPAPGHYIGEPEWRLAQEGRVKINHYAHAYYEPPKMVAGVPTYEVDSWTAYH